MKLLSTYLKELKIALRGFTYIEIFVALVLLLVIMVAINDNPDSKVKEYVFYDMSEVQYQTMLDQQLASANIIQLEDSKLKLKVDAFDVLNKDTEKLVSYNFDEKKNN